MSHASVLIAASPDELTLHGSVEAVVEWNMLPFDENGEWFKDGSRWDWYQIGGRYRGKLCGKDVALRGELSDEQIAEFKVSQAKQTWAHWEAEKIKDAVMRSIVYGFDEHETEETLVAKSKGAMISAYAFLRKRCWHEGERLGWLGGSAKTECEIKTGEELVGKCLFRDKESGASIVSWNDPDFGKRFWDRFVRKLPADTTLISVDYHV